MDNPKLIFTADLGERIVSVVSYRGRALIATERRILEWTPETETFHVLEFVTLSPPDSAATVYAAERWRP